MRKEEGGTHFRHRKNNKSEMIGNDYDTTKLFERSILQKNIYHRYVDFILT
jgi:hypothetical protein